MFREDVGNNEQTDGEQDIAADWSKDLGAHQQPKTKRELCQWPQ